jgi:hypothetical protein
MELKLNTNMELKSKLIYMELKSKLINMELKRKHKYGT